MTPDGKQPGRERWVDRKDTWCKNYQMGRCRYPANMCNRAHTQEEFDEAVKRFAKKKWISAQHPSVAEIDGCEDLEPEKIHSENPFEERIDLEREPHDHDNFVLIWDVDFRKNFEYNDKNIFSIDHIDNKYNRGATLDQAKHLPRLVPDMSSPSAHVEFSRNIALTQVLRDAAAQVDVLSKNTVRMRWERQNTYLKEYSYLHG